MDKYTDRLSDYLDGELNEAEREELEAHLLECADCGRTLQELRAVVARAGQVIDRPPQDDLWPAIATRIAAPALPKRIALSVPQLAAASIVLLLLSSGVMFLMMNKRPAQVAALPVQQQQDAQQPVITRDVVPANVKSVAAENYHVAISELENALKSSRTTLDTATVRVLETNLRTIDAAIAEARLALGNDPANPYLNRYLDETMQKKIQLLRRATGILRAQT